MRVCSRCGGAAFPESDLYGRTLSCLICGSQVEIDRAGEIVPVPPLEELAPSNRRVRRDPYHFGPRSGRTGTAVCGAITTNGGLCQQLVVTAVHCRFHSS